MGDAHGGRHRDASGRRLGREITADDVEAVNWAQGEFAGDLSATHYAQALAAVSQFRRAVHQWWADGWDLLLSPTLGEPPVRIGTLYDADDGSRPTTRWPVGPRGSFVPFTPPFNASGQPAISLPLHWNADGLPVGVQLVAAYGREDLLIGVASQLEVAVPWADRHPSL